MSAAKALTQKQKDLLFFAKENRGQATGDYYCETGSCKPWNIKTVRSLVSLGLATIAGEADGCVYLRLTDEGRSAAPDKMPAHFLASH
jgi:DNA-binding MarR family transcriptional regulator